VWENEISNCHSVGIFVRAGTEKDVYTIGIASEQHDIHGIIKFRLEIHIILN
jgi:hypothetical protein